MSKMKSRFRIGNSDGVTKSGKALEIIRSIGYN